MFVPIGLLVENKWYYGIGISLFIELGQLILKRGLFEFDDIFHNCIGLVVGYILYCIIKKIKVILIDKDQLKNKI